MVLHKWSLTVLVAVGLCAAAPSLAGPYTDELSKCLVEFTTAEDRADLVTWMFTAASAHPAVRPFSTVTEEQMDTANRKMGRLITRLLTDSCEDAARKALKYEGGSTIETSFQVLGQVAGRELFGSPEVTKALSALEKYVDSDRIKALREEQE